MIRIGISVVLAFAGSALGGHTSASCGGGIPAFSQANRPAMCRPAPNTSLPVSRSRITGFEPVCRPIVPCNPNPCETPCVVPCDSWLPIGPGVWADGVWTNVPEVVVVETPVVAPAPVEVDAAMVAMWEERYTFAAAEFLRRHEARVLEESNTDGGAIPDRTWLRLNGLALAGAGDFAGAARAMARAYAEDPALSVDPIDGSEVVRSTTELRRILVGCVRHAHRDGTAAAWELVGRVMEAEGRFARAQVMFVRAESVD